MNSPLRKVSMFVALLLAALLLNITWISAARTESLLENSRNRRVRDAEFAQNRGAILVGNQPIAISDPTKTTRFPYERHYPKGNLYSSVTGWYSYTYATQELERSYNQELAGTGSEQSVARVIDLLSGRKPQGANISTTLNAKAQQAALNALGDQQGAAIAMDYTTGKILALVSTPSYDPNLLSSIELSAVSKNWIKLLDDKAEPLKNRAVREIFPPGSTFKLVTAAAALEAGMLPSTLLDSPQSLQLPGSNHTMGNSTNCGGDKTTMEHALVVSCNTAFGSLGMKLGGDKLREMAEKFGFNAAPGIDLPSVKSRFPSELDQAQTALSAIGQYEVAATPLQMLQVAAAIANDGKLMKPYLVSTVTGRDLRVISSHSPQEVSRPLSESNAKLLQQMMIKVAAEGTGRRAEVAGLTIGGKTGTAQSAPGRPPYSWFVGFAKDPKVAIVAFVQSSDSEETGGSRVAAPIFKAILEALK